MQLHFVRVHSFIYGDVLQPMVILASKCKDLRRVSIFTKWTTVLCNSVNYSNASKSKCVIYVSLHTTLRMVWEIYYPCERGLKQAHLCARGFPTTGASTKMRPKNRTRSCNATLLKETARIHYNST